MPFLDARSSDIGRNLDFEIFARVVDVGELCLHCWIFQHTRRRPLRSTPSDTSYASDTSDTSYTSYTSYRASMWENVLALRRSWLDRIMSEGVRKGGLEPP